MNINKRTNRTIAILLSVLIALTSIILDHRRLEKIINRDIELYCQSTNYPNSKEYKKCAKAKSIQNIIYKVRSNK